MTAIITTVGKQEIEVQVSPVGLVAVQMTRDGENWARLLLEPAQAQKLARELETAAVAAPGEPGRLAKMLGLAP